MDKISKQHRSWNMSRVRGNNTKLEKLARLWLFKRGYRYRKNVRNLPGKPDIVLRKYKTVIDVRGCFWHRHAGCKIATMPQSNTTYWWKKFNANIGRDIENESKLDALGWNVIVVWECELTSALEETMRKIVEILENRKIEIIKSREPRQILRYDELEDTDELMMVAESDLE